MKTVKHGDMCAGEASFDLHLLVQRVASFSVDQWLCYTRLFDMYRERTSNAVSYLENLEQRENFQMMQQAYGNEAMSSPAQALIRWRKGRGQRQSQRRDQSDKRQLAACSLLINHARAQSWLKSILEEAIETPPSAGAEEETTDDSHDGNSQPVSPGGDKRVHCSCDAYWCSVYGAGTCVRGP
uniref:Uncharacterized protein n=1 Tax=Timema poppense TaxID=170557 RepID=A0A7R9H2B7_TIMPO|nr:unnamed protein product [Timema poppensis]